MQNAKRHRGLTLVEVVVVCLALFFLFVLFLPPLGQSREEARRTQCNIHLKQLMLALHNYHDRYGSLPPAYVADANGKPMHSWRVLVMEFIETSFTHRYDFSEPWDSPNNSLLVEEYPYMPCYTCPSNRGNGLSYMAVVGENTVWPNEKSIGFRDIIDGTSNTIALVEVSGVTSHWMEPVDLKLDQLPLQINPPNQIGISSDHLRNGANVAFADGAIRFLDEETSEEQLQQYLLRNDEADRWDSFE